MAMHQASELGSLCLTALPVPDPRREHHTDRQAGPALLNPSQAAVGWAAPPTLIQEAGLDHPSLPQVSLHRIQKVMHSLPPTHPHTQSR